MNKVVCGQAWICGKLSCFHKSEHQHNSSAGCDDLHCGETPGNTQCVEVASAQQQVAENTKARGYRDGWTAEQFAARQVAKLVEELGELVVYIWAHKELRKAPGWEKLTGEAAEDAKKHFDDKSRWALSWVMNADDAKAELADIQVVVFNLAQALSEVTRKPFDVIKSAVEKSAADVDRGVR